ncbi:MAG: RNA methyltransferase [Bacteroidales bacterium]|nr:RNA methyltransferase [Bacteroidales bacterium]MCF8457148.1 RNA methyltransferase [Bacteroidales bacterium]
MLSNNKIKLISSLQRKKMRDESSLFVAEGNKLVLELLESDFQIKHIVALPCWLSGKQFPIGIELIETDLPGMKKISSLTTPTEVLAVVEMPKLNLDFSDISQQLALVLDDIRDPGNLGTIIRLADWFGIENIICSIETVDVFNPKVVQATMGAILRVKLHYMDLAAFIEDISKQNKIPVYGTYMDGTSIYKEKLTQPALLVMGNEGKGISPELKKYISKTISIPTYAKSSGSESLNVAVATGIVLSEFKRQEPNSAIRQPNDN